VIVRPHQLVVCVNDMKHDAVVFFELCVGRDDELVGDVDRAAERCAIAADADRRRGNRRGRWLAAAAGGKRHRRDDESRRSSAEGFMAHV
jgi:hypothetical protein